MVIVAAIVESAAVAVFAQTVRVPGTKVSLVPPPGFSLAQQYPGFEREADQASIMVTELPTPAAEMIKAMTAPALATRGMTLVSSQQAVIDGHAARLLSVRQKTPAGDVLKSMLIAGDPSMTIMIVGMSATDASSSTAAEIRRALLSATWGSAAPGAFEGLPFRVTAICGPFRRRAQSRRRRAWTWGILQAARFSSRASMRSSSRPMP
jgi:hypothetical protein